MFHILRLKLGVAGATQTQGKKANTGRCVAADAKKALQGKANSLLGQLQKFATSAKILEKEDLIKLFYDIYNEEHLLDVEQIEAGAFSNNGYTRTINNETYHLEIKPALQQPHQQQPKPAAAGKAAAKQKRRKRQQLLSQQLQ